MSARAAPTRRITDAGVGEIPTTRARRLILNRPGFRGGSVTWNQPRLGRVSEGKCSGSISDRWLASNSAGGDEPDLAVKAPVVEPVDVLGDGDLDIADRLPSALGAHDRVAD